MVKLEKKLASKKDLKKFATKKDLKKLRQDIIEEVGKKIDRVLTAVDSIARTHLMSILIYT
ncbi:hypothetical protein KAI65_00295 [Candidatus Parcubacteria bacterium]|nr:hypothetical protein [Candidatus Parcubacteria bacterium]